LGSLVFCTILYILFSYVLSGVGTVEDFRSAGREASVAFAISKYMHGYEWLSRAVTVAILGGFFASASALSNPVQIEHAVLCFHGPPGRVCSGRCHRRNDQYRNIVRVHS